MSKFIYRPPPDEPAEMITYNRRWKANVPVEISEDPNKDGILVSETVRQNNPDGTYFLITRERRIGLAEILRGNRMFEEDGVERAAPPEVHPEDMTMPGEYRAYAQKWFLEEIDLHAFQERWDDEAELREQCGMTPDDVRALQPFFNQRMATLKQGAKDERLRQRL
jgi:hypothetical protein